MSARHIVHCRWKKSVDKLHKHHEDMKSRFEHEIIGEFYHQVGTALSLAHSPIDDERARSLHEVALSLQKSSESVFNQRKEEEDFNQGFTSPPQTPKQPRLSRGAVKNPRLSQRSSPSMFVVPTLVNVIIARMFTCLVF